MNYLSILLLLFALGATIFLGYEIVLLFRSIKKSKEADRKFNESFREFYKEISKDV